MKVSCMHFSALLHPCLVEFLTAKSLASDIFQACISKVNNKWQAIKLIR